METIQKERTFDEVSFVYLENKKVELKPKTYNGQKGQMTVFSLWLIDNGMPNRLIKDIDKDIIDHFFIYLANTRDLDRPTCKKYFNILRGVFDYALDRNEIDILPFKKVPFPKKKKDCSAEVIPPEQLKPLLEDIRKNDKQLFLACLIEYCCFIRPGTELRLIKGENFDMNAGTIKIEANIAKNGKQRIVTMPNHLIEACSEYGIGKTDPNLYVFGKNKHFDTRPVSVNMLRYRFNQFRDEHHLSKGVKLYSLKHSGITSLHNSGLVSLSELMTQIGHHNLTATQYYIKKRCMNVNNTIKNSFVSPL
jgi:integrase